MMRVSKNDLTVLTRFHDIRKIDDLDLTLFSILGQNDASLKSIILGQDISEESAGLVDEICEKYREYGLDVEFLNFRFEAQGDHRAELLNKGIERVTTRYLSFLDCDDVVYPSCYVRLIRRLRKTTSALAMTGVLRADQFEAAGAKFTKSKIHLFKGFPKARFFIGNQYPIHSYVIDLYRVDREDLFFDKGVTRNEDYAFLYRLLSKYSFDDEECRRANCEYRVDMAGSNTILAYRSDRDSVEAWALAEQYMNSVRASRRITLDHRDLQDLKEHYYAIGVSEMPSIGRTPEVTQVAQADSDCSEKVNSLSDALIACLMGSIDNPSNKNLTLNVEDQNFAEDGSVRVSGWCAVDTCSPSALLFYAGGGKGSCLVTNLEHRADVAEHLNSDDIHFGFSAELPPCEELKVVAVARAGFFYQCDLRLDT